MLGCLVAPQPVIWRIWTSGCLDVGLSKMLMLDWARDVLRTPAPNVLTWSSDEVDAVRAENVIVDKLASSSLRLEVG